MKLKTRSSLEHLALGRLGSSRNGEGREALGGRIGVGGVGSVASINSATELGHSDGEDCREKFRHQVLQHVGGPGGTGLFVKPLELKSPSYNI